ncbi:unnamed protein product [Urochloa humidicola]
MDRHPKRTAAAAAAPVVLPHDALVEILSRLPARSLCRSKCVSRSWRDLIAGRLRCTNLPQALEGFFYFFDSIDDDAGAETHDIDINDDGGKSRAARVLLLPRERAGGPGVRAPELLQRPPPLHPQEGRGQLQLARPPRVQPRHGALGGRAKLRMED